MPINNHRLERIQEYGLTEYEARAFLALLDIGVGTAHDVAALSRVPRTKIYSVLDALHEKRLVEIIPERPKRYQPVSFDDYLENVKHGYQSKLHKLEADRKVMSREFAPCLPVEPERAGRFRVLKGRKNVVRRVLEMLNRATAEAVIMGSHAQATRLAHFLPLLRQRAKDGVKIRILLPVDERNEVVARELADVATVRHMPESSGSTIAVVDGREALLGHPIPDDGHVFQGEDIAIWSDDGAIVSDLSGLVDVHWERGEDIAVRLEALAGGTSLSQQEVVR